MPPLRPRDRQRGAALALTLIAITALLGLGAITVMSVHSEIAATAQSRFNYYALYAAESGAAAGMEFLRNNCRTMTGFTTWVTWNNKDPLKPDAIIGNKLKPGDNGNLFASSRDMWYEVAIYNNLDDPGLAPVDGDLNPIAPADTDFTVVLHSTGYGPDNTVATVELSVKSPGCVANFCASDFAQKGVSSLNDANNACAARVTSGTMRTFSPGGP
jgi:hypothetical protein